MKNYNFSKGLKRVLNVWQLYLLLLIPIIYLIIFQYVPMFGAQIAFKKFSPVLGIIESPWIGFDNFTRFFNSYQFVRVIKNTLLISLYTLIAGFPVPIILALAINCVRSLKFKKFVQTITYIPHFISIIVMVGILFQLFNPVIGIFGRVYYDLTGNRAPDLMGIPAAFRHMYVWSGIWQNMGFNSIIYIAALAGISPELHEAAEIDGASRFKRVIHIDLPGIMPTATILLILATGRIMSVGFEKIYLMQNNLNLTVSEIISTYVYKVGLGSGRSDFSFATAIGLFNSVINFILIMSVNKVSNKLSETSLW